MARLILVPALWFVILHVRHLLMKKNILNLDGSLAQYTLRNHVNVHIM
jgi:hypothetical protein